MNKKAWVHIGAVSALEIRCHKSGTQSRYEELNGVPSLMARNMTSAPRALPPAPRKPTGLGAALRDVALLLLLSYKGAPWHFQASYIMRGPKW